MHPQTDCSFFTKLAFEVRVLIYELVLGNCLISTAIDTTYRSRDFDPFIAFWQTASPAAHLIKWSPWSLPRRLMPSEGSRQSTRDSRGPIAVALLLTSRLVYRECVRLLYASNAFSFPDLQDFEEFSSRYLDNDDDNDSEKRIAWVKKLQISSGNMIFKVPKVVFGASNLKLLSIGVDPDTILLAGLYTPHSDALRVLLKLSDLPKLTQIEIFWTTWPPWCLSELCSRRWAHEAKASSGAISKPLTRIASYPGGREEFCRQHCNGGLTLVHWIQVQVMESMRDQGYSCIFQNLYWTEVVPSLMAGTKTGSDALEGDEDDDISSDVASDWSNADSRERAYYTNFVSSAKELNKELSDLEAEIGEKYENVYGEMLEFTI